jgi:hypothetical protein
MLFLPSMLLLGGLVQVNLHWYLNSASAESLKLRMLLLIGIGTELAADIKRQGELDDVKIEMSQMDTSNIQSQTNGQTRGYQNDPFWTNQDEQRRQNQTLIDQ